MDALLTAAQHIGPGFGGGPLVFALLIPLFWVLVFVTLFAIFGRRFRRARMDGHGSWGPYSRVRSAEQTLAQRFANGDIEEVEYRARLEVLRASTMDPRR